MQVVCSYLAILGQETGWEVYDGQLGRSEEQPAVTFACVAQGR